MALIVQKYGGTSVGMVERIRNVARRVAAARARGDDVVVVVSAMSGETNRLLNLANQVSSRVDEREIDVLLASGEQVSCALLALALKDLGQPARSFLGHQVRIATDSVFGRARIKSIDSNRVLESLKRNEVVVVAGFQGVDEGDNITTLGRGGSDTSAVAMAAALGARIEYLLHCLPEVRRCRLHRIADPRRLRRQYYRCHPRPVGCRLRDRRR